jgi:Flp pilus assembly protein TadD
MWNNYPLYAGLGLNWWGVNSLSYMFGYNGYYNPYYVPTGSSVVYDYSQPLVYTTPAPIDDGDQAFVPEARPAADAAEAARTAFLQSDFNEAISQAERAIKAEPQDPVMHQLRALALFALSRFDEAAAVVHTVLATSPGWDWTTMIGFYQNADDYTKQLRALEHFRNSNEDNAAAHFLLAYHYITLGHTDDARIELKEVIRLQPKDTVAANLLRSLGPADGEAAAETPVAPPANQTPIDPAQLVGAWAADRGDGATFRLMLDAQDKFAWSFTQGNQQQEVTGTYRVEDNTLLMAPSSGGTLAAALALAEDGGLSFRIIGGDPNDPGLVFRNTK